jgi:hypothetical protein
MALKCPDCSAENEVGEYYCTSCGQPLLPEDMIPTAARRRPAGQEEAAAVTTLPPPLEQAASAAPESDRRYRIILGDSCTICRAVSRITFTADRPPRLPVAGCRDPGGCRCSMPVFAADVEATVKALSAPPALRVVDAPRPAPQPQPGTPVAPPSQPDWKSPAPATQRREHALQELTQLYLQRRIQGIRIATAPGCCRVCAEISESIYDPAIAPPIPIVGCEHGWQCCCQYAEEPMPLDSRGLEAMQRLERMERERQLRRRGIAIGGPRALHIVAGVLALIAIAAAVWSVLSAAAWPGWLVALPLVPAVISVAVAVMAIRRWRPLPPPARTYVLCGLVLLVLGLGPLWGLALPAGLDLQHLDRLAAVTATPQLSTTALLALSRGLQMLALAGLLLLLTGLVDSSLATREEAR